MLAIAWTDAAIVAAGIAVTWLLIGHIPLGRHIEDDDPERHPDTIARRCFDHRRLP